MNRRKKNKGIEGVAFQKEARRERNARKRVRLLGMAKLQEGKSIAEVSRLFGVTWKTVQRWKNRFIKQGLEGLADRHKSGRKPKVRTSDGEKIKKAIEKAQEKKNGGRITGREIQTLLQEQFQATYDLDSVYKVLKRLRMVWITVRSIHPKADRAAQNAFKKTLLKKSKKWSLLHSPPPK